MQSAVQVPSTNHVRTPGSMADAFRNLQYCVQNSRNAMFFTDPSGVLERVNPAFEKLTGYSSLEVVGKDLNWILAGGESLEATRKIWERVSNEVPFHGTLDLKTKDGGNVKVDMAVNPVRDNRGRLTAMVGDGYQIGRAGFEREPDGARDPQNLATLAAGVAHDFNNMLMVITAQAELAIDSVSPPDPLWRRMQEIRIAARRAAALTRQLLALARKQAGVSEVLSLNSLVQETCAMLPSLLGEDIELSVNLDAENVQVQADFGKLQQALLNLAINARDAMPKGGSLAIETSAAKLPVEMRDGVAANYVLLTVSDTGQGIAASELSRIFEPFYTTKANGKGNGLGLAMVRATVEEFGGFVSVDSTPGLGSTFHIYLPSAESRKVATDAKNESKLQLDRGSETVLVVEDETAVRESTVEFLSKAGYQVLSAANGQEALKAIETHPGEISLTITDLVMPRMSGLTLSQMLAIRHPETKVLFVSAYGNDILKRKGMGEAAGNCLQKPFSLQMLAAKVRETLDRLELTCAAAAGRSG